MNLFEPKSMGLFIAVRDREERQPSLVWPYKSRSMWPAGYEKACMPETRTPGSRCDGTGRRCLVVGMAGQTGLF
jgi:hypothetical protein